MLKLVYVITMAIAFTSRFMGADTNYYLRLSMGLLWIILWAVKSRGVLSINKFLKYLIFPWICIFLLTLGLWIVNRPDYFDFSYVTRMCSNVIYCLVATVNAYIGIKFFGKDVIRLSLFSLLCSIGLNFINVWMAFGTSNLMVYLTTILTAKYEYGSILEQISMDMEVQGATMALGTYFLYFLLCEKETRKYKRILYLLLSLIGLYLGFKRVVLLGVLVVIGILWILEFKQVGLQNVIRYTFVCFLIISFGYIIVVKTDIISYISNFFNVDMMGRNNIYKNVAKLFQISPFYLGTGYGYVSKYMFDTTGFAAHSDIVRMYAELGFFPFVGWLWYYLSFIPQKVVINYGRDAGKICIIITVFTFSTYLVENTMGLYPLQYALTMFTILMLAKDANSKKFLTY